jgi:putative transcriptional regulator
MTKDILIHQIVDVLKRANFVVSKRCNIRPRSFDITARKDDILIFCKALYNIDGLNEETAQEMKSLAKYLNGSALIVGAKTRNQMLEDGVVYIRYGIPALNVQTLYDYFVESVPPLVSAAPGGLYVSIDGDVLREARMSVSMSIGTIASQLGVSRRTISKYEEGGMDASIDIALQLEELFDVALAKSIDVLEFFDNKLQEDEENNEYETKPPEDNILNLISTLGYDVLSTNQAPFRGVSKKDTDVILTGISKYCNSMIKRAELMSSISNVTGSQSVFIIKDQCNLKSESFDSTVFIKRDELNKLLDPEDLLQLIEERMKNNNKSRSESN